MRASFSCLLVICSALFASGTTDAANISIISGSMNTAAHNSSGAAQNNIINASLPLSTTDLVTDGLVSSSTTYNFSNAGFHISVEHTRQAGGADHARSLYQLPIVFTLDQDEAYTITGSYGQSGTGRIVFAFELYDLTAGGATVFRNQQQSHNATNESFTLGLLEGTASPSEQFLGGSLTGTLIGGHNYELRYNFLISRNVAVSAASASGFFNLQIGDAPQEGVPEPASVVLSLLGLAGVVLFGRRQLLTH